jgi:hypothetical protein
MTEADATIERILFYIGYRAGMARKRLAPIPIEPKDIQVPARDIIAIINGEQDVMKLVDDEWEEE